MPLNVVYRTQNNGEREVIDPKGETPEVLGKKKPSEQKEPRGITREWGERSPASRVSRQGDLRDRGISVRRKSSAEQCGVEQSKKKRKESEEMNAPEGIARRNGLQADTVPVAGLGEDGVAPPGLDRIQADRTVQRVLQAVLRSGDVSRVIVYRVIVSYIVY